jgi:hypothetical protein
MGSHNESLGLVRRRFIRTLLIACLTMVLVVLWGEGRSQNIQTVMHGVPLTATLVLSLCLLVLSALEFTSQRRISVYGILVGIGGVLVCLLPTV